MRSRRSESGMTLLPLVAVLSIGLGAAFLLRPSFDREDLLEGQRLRAEQARAAAEGAIALALHRGKSVAGVEIGRATASAVLTREGDEVLVEATATVPWLRDAVVAVRVTARYLRGEGGGLTLVAWREG